MVSRRSRKSDRRSAGPPPLVVAFLGIEALAVIVLPLVGVALSDVALAVAPATTVTMAFLNPTLQELGRRQAKLTIVAEQDGGDGVMNAAALRPWPVDIERVIANELAEAWKTLSSHARLSDMPPGLGALCTRPSEADHTQARDAFEQEMPEFEASLRTWLAKYSIAAERHSRSFDLTLRMDSARNGAHAEGVRVVLDLPATVSVIDERPAVPLPPERPVYEPPPYRLVGGVSQAWLTSLAVTPVAWGNIPAAIPQVSLSEPPWRIEGPCLEAAPGEVHAGRSVTVGEPLLLLADGPGRHEIRWTVYTKSARRRAEGAVTLVVPPGTDRSAFGRLHGITSYPDVPIVDSDGEIVHDVRGTDPPPRPPVGKESGDVKARLRQRGASWTWHTLGLDPAADSPVDRSPAECDVPE